MPQERPVVQSAGPEVILEDSAIVLIRNQSETPLKGCGLFALEGIVSDDGIGDRLVCQARPKRCAYEDVVKIADEQIVRNLRVVVFHPNPAAAVVRKHSP